MVSPTATTTSTTRQRSTSSGYKTQSWVKRGYRMTPMASSAKAAIPVGTATGTYYLIAKVDADNAVSETNESNNTSVWAIQIGPDLIIFALSAPTTAGAGATITVT